MFVFTRLLNIAKGFWADFLNLKLSGPIKVLLCDVIITVQSILCSVTPLFAGLRFLWEHIWCGGLLCLRNHVSGKCWEGNFVAFFFFFLKKCDCNPGIMGVCWLQGQCRKTDLTSASCSWMQQCRHVAQCLHCCTTTYTFDAPVVHENKHESVCCYFIKLVSKKKIGARVLAWPLTLTCLRCAHMLALYLQWRLFLIILHNVAAVINSPEFEGKTCPNQGFCVLSNKSRLFSGKCRNKSRDHGTAIYKM